VSVAFVLNELGDFLRGVVARLQLRMLGGETETDALRFADRKTEIHAGAVGVSRISGDVLLLVVGLTEEQVVTTADAVEREIRIEIIERDCALEFAPAD